MHYSIMTFNNSVTDNCILYSHSCIWKLLHLQPYFIHYESVCLHNENIDIYNWDMAIHNWNKDIHNWNINFHNWILDVHNWIMDARNWIIQSPCIPWVTLCFCTGSYVPLPPPPPTTDICSRDNFWITFWISFIFGRINDPHLHIRLPD